MAPPVASHSMPDDAFVALLLKVSIKSPLHATLSGARPNDFRALMAL
jgi:hypothetical protein